ncbi:MAG: proline dehydrogenase family protein [Bacteroidota bacterium]
MALTEKVVDFSNTKIAFSNKTDKELIKMAWLFKMMNNNWLVNFGSKMGLLALRLRLPFTESIIRKTIFEQFVGGRTLLECEPNIKKLYEYDSLTILDYGAEAKTTEQDFNRTMNENIRAIEFAHQHNSVPVISTKISGLARFGLLESIQKGASLTRQTRREYRAVLKRVDSICHYASERNVAVFFDAEESWVQDTIDHLVNLMMKRYNRERVVIYNTFQMYRHDRLQFLFDSFDEAQREGYMLGAKLVRGAYMEKERRRAEEMGYPSPIQPSKQATDDAYNTAVRFCVDHYEKMASCNATHNQKSCLLQAELIAERNLSRIHPHLNFCQLYGMSDQITFNLADAGYNVAKYMPYGQVKEVVPYLIRRAQENSAVAGDLSREYEQVNKEVKRRSSS